MGRDRHTLGRLATCLEYPFLTDYLKTIREIMRGEGPSVSPLSNDQFRPFG